MFWDVGIDCSCFCGEGIFVCGSCTAVVLVVVCVSMLLFFSLLSVMTVSPWTVFSTFPVFPPKSPLMSPLPLMACSSYFCMSATVWGSLTTTFPLPCTKSLWPSYRTILTLDAVETTIDSIGISIYTIVIPRLHSILNTPYCVILPVVDIRFWWRRRGGGVGTRNRLIFFVVVEELGVVGHQCIFYVIGWVREIGDWGWWGTCGWGCRPQE